MRLDEIEQSTLPPLELYIDNPAKGGDDRGIEWLENKRKRSLENGFNDSDSLNVMGPVTGTYNREAFIPIDILANIKGYHGEQGRVREPDLKWLVSHMKKTGKLPPSEAYNHGEYPPLIAVDQRGEVRVLEGNHRIMAAKKVGFEVLPVTIRFFNGGEQEQSILSPDKVEQYDTKALSQGYTFGKYQL